MELNQLGGGQGAAKKGSGCGVNGKGTVAIGKYSPGTGEKDKPTQFDATEKMVATRRPQRAEKTKFEKFEKLEMLDFLKFRKTPNQIKSKAGLCRVTSKTMNS